MRLISFYTLLLGFLASAGGALADPLAGAEWRVRDVNAGSPLLSADAAGVVPGYGLELIVTADPGARPWSSSCTVHDMRSEDRAVTLALIVPVDARGWTWWDDPETRRTIGGSSEFMNVTSSYYGALLMASRYPLAAISNDEDAFCLAVPPHPGRAVRFLYDPVALEFRAEFDFGLTPLTERFPSAADASVIAFETPAAWAFREGLERYYYVYADALQRRAGPGGTLLRGSPIDTIASPEDFGFAWHDFATEYVSVYEWSRIDEALGVQSFLYREPQTHWRALRGNLVGTAHTNFDDGTSGDLVADGSVTCVNGIARIANSAALRVPGTPTTEPEDLEAEFTLCNLSEVMARDVFDLGWQGRFWCGLRKTDATGGVAKAGAFDFWALGPQKGESFAAQAATRMTVKMVVSKTENVTRVYAAYDSEARDGAKPPKLHLVGLFPWGTWTSEAGFPLYIRNWSGVPIEIDDVIVTRFSGAPEPTYETYLAQLTEDAQRGDAESQATMVSGAFDASGRYDLYLGDIVWAASVPFGVNAAPGVRNTGLEPWPNKMQFEEDTLSYFLGWEGRASLMEGVYFDSMQGWGNVRNYRREHWKTAAYPLTFDRVNDNAVCLMNIWGNVACAERLSQLCRAHGQMLAGNDTYYQVWYHMPFVDVAGREITNYADGVWSPPDDETYLYFRSMAGRRPFWTLMNDPYDDGSHIEDYFQRSLFYGVFPSMYHAHDGQSPWYWATPEHYERDRPLFVKYLPLIRALDNAGWQPVPYATVSPDAVRIERFGNPATGDLAFTLHNPSGAPVEALLRLDLPALRASEITGVTEWIAGSNVAVTHDGEGCVEVSVPLPAQGYAAVGVEAVFDPRLMADVDRSGAVNAVDVQLVINGALGIETKFLCDVNGDHAVNALDVQLAVNAALGIGIGR